MTDQNKVSGKIINHNSSFIGDLYFSEKINELKINDSDDYNNIIIPGFIDLHCHGGNGFDVMEGSQSIIEMSKYHLMHGTTSIMPTTWTNNLENTISALKGFNEIKNHNPNILGIHLEGPFINPNKLGAQPNLTEKPSLDFIKKILEISDVKIITLAPEIDGMQEFINNLVDLNIKVQFGHTLADFSCCEKIMKDYEVGFTHLYNAMSGNDHRSPGVLSAALSRGKYAEIICDNIHVSKEAIKIAKKCIPSLYAITDSINASGLKDGEYIFANNNIKKENNSVKVKSDNTLAGSIVTMDQTFKNLVSMDFSLEEAVALTSYNASKYLNLNNIGIIQKNFLSNFLILDKEFNIKEVYLRGKKVNV
ncbi:N-acetylglucosamine-6-phosphate deacetylase [Pelagibacteraceae bacterium]|nr:N-acetylglucosamine-6-phosphate deacetylase [Pelagibacteraceae bacterium]